MTSSAIPAQGTTLQIGTGNGPGKTITAIVAASPTILTSAAHGLSNGDVVTLAALAGVDAPLLNGQVLVVKSKTDNTFAVDVDTTGKTITAGAGTATPVAWTEIGNVTTFKGFDGQAAELDATNLKSTAKEVKQGLQDWGQFTFDVHKDFADAGQQALDAAKRAAALKPIKFTLPNGKTRTFNAYVKNSPIEGGVDQLVKSASVTLRISGDVVDA
ncbi:phage tail tube protein [Cupriavidus sp. YAF13]|uniref:phage tail tube protein n=1 Tax=Cupriavidus sp. YAF13 TaxID=3233075 RepID=UPI003F92C1B9